MSHASDLDDRRQQLRRLGYSCYLRTGRVPMEIKSALGEDIFGGYWVKFNPYHDPENGRFTFAPGHPNARSDVIISRGRNALMPGQTPKTPARIKPKPEPKYKSSLGQLSERQEAKNSDPGTISNGKGDKGGVSYGSYQFASKNGSVQKFLASPDAKPWADAFHDLEPATPAFDAQWRRIARQEPEAFREAQFSYIARTHYEPAVRSVLKTTGYNLNNASEAVRQVTYSLSVQHGRAAALLSDSIRLTDQSLKRTDPEYQRALINNIYDRRIKYVSALQNAALRKGEISIARNYGNTIKNRYPKERDEALNLLVNREAILLGVRK